MPYASEKSPMLLRVNGIVDKQNKCQNTNGSINNKQIKYIYVEKLQYQLQNVGHLKDPDPTLIKTRGWIRQKQFAYPTGQNESL